MTTGDLLVGTGLTARFGDAVVFDALDVGVAAGSVTGVVGRSGSGKTTLLRILAGLTVLRRLCLDASLVDPDHLGVASAKTDELIAALREVVAEGHRALVFSQFTTYLDTVVERLRDEGITVAHLDGLRAARAGLPARAAGGARPRRGPHPRGAPAMTARMCS